jgi:hypothetical protein
LPWLPTYIERLDSDRPIGTSTAPLRCKTDAGSAYAKTMGNPEGPDALSCEYIGTWLASWLGLPTFDTAILDFPEDLSVPYPNNNQAQPGPAFVSRAVIGRPWSGTSSDLQLLDNPETISGLVVFDTWTRNCDRYCPHGERVRQNINNVFFSEEGASAGKYRLLAIDHTECFRCGRSLSKGLFKIDQTKEEKIYGLFPGFMPFVTTEAVAPFLSKLRTFRLADFDVMISRLPGAWGLRPEIREAMKDFCVQRASFLSAHFVSYLTAALQQEVLP